MNNLLQDLVYECLFFLDWKEYYDICKKMDISLKLNVYFKHSVYRPSLNDVCKEKEEYLEIIEYLSEVEKCTYKHVNASAINGNLDTIKYLYMCGAKCSQKAIRSCIEFTNNIKCIKYLIDNSKYPDYSIEACLLLIYRKNEIFSYIYDNKQCKRINIILANASKYGQLEIIKYVINHPKTDKSLPNFSKYINRSIELAKMKNHNDVVEYLEQQI